MAKQLFGQLTKFFFDPILDKLIDTVFKYLQYKPRMKDNLERLRDNYPKVQAILSAARRVLIIDQDPALNKWIWQLRDAIDEADDLFDDFEYLKHKDRLDKNKEELIQGFSYFKNISNGAKRLCTRNAEDPLIMKRLEEVVQKLDILFAGASALLHLLDIKKQEHCEQYVELQKTRETGSLPKSYLIGRGKDRESVLQWLRKPSNEKHQAHVTSSTSFYNNISLLSIVGHGGMGKTTLLQHVYADVEITKEFDLKMWVCVSSNFDVKKVIADMLECHENKSPSLNSLQALQERLKSKVGSNKFLLVLDDIWDEKEEGVVLPGKWEDVLVPLADGGLGSKILITTRTKSVASMIAKVIRKEREVMELEGLEEDECLELLNTHAFPVGENPDDHKKLKPIAGELAKKLYGSPLAAKVIGGVLSSSLDERHWKYVLNNGLVHNDIFSILKLSYIFLPEYLQSCFTFCSLFPQDHIFNKDDMVSMWIAVGFIKPRHNNQEEAFTLEDIGERYLDALIKKSFFEEIFINGESTKKYRMHDLLHELAQFVSTQECFRYVGYEKLHLEIPKTIRHLSIETSNPKVLKMVGRCKQLRTLYITSNFGSDLVDALIEIFQVTRSIRLLHLPFYVSKEIPEAIGYLRHLRYLSSAKRLDELPRAVSSLCHLQFIICSGNYWSYGNDNDLFPIKMDINNLSNLRFLSTWKINFPGMGKLKFLKEVRNFNIKNENGYRIEELKHINEIQLLGINFLDNVRDAGDAYNAKLCDKRKLKYLTLSWNHERVNANREVDERVLDNLQPHKYLKYLCISHYIGARSAIWMNEAHLINNLENISLQNCVEWEILPPFVQLPFLKNLCLNNMPKVKRLETKRHGNNVCSIFRSLQNLSFRNMTALVDWFDASVVDELFPCLTELLLNNCPNLQELPYLPPKLEYLAITSIGWKALNFCSISKSIPIKRILVHDCENITSISVAGEIGELEVLSLVNLPSLQSLPSSLTNISSLKNPDLRGLPQIRAPSLKLLGNK